MTADKIVPVIRLQEFPECKRTCNMLDCPPDVAIGLDC